MSAWSRLFFVVVLILSATTVACDGPCRSLAEQICSCEANETREILCLNRVDNSVREPQENDNAECEALLRTCTCDAIDRGDFKACGLTLEGEPQ